MRIKVMIALAGRGFSCTGGEVVDLPEDIARDLIEAGHAVPAKPVRDAVGRAPGKATSPASSSKRRGS